MDIPCSVLKRNGDCKSCREIQRCNFETCNPRLVRQMVGTSFTGHDGVVSEKKPISPLTLDQ